MGKSFRSNDKYGNKYRGFRKNADTTKKNKQNRRDYGDYDDNNHWDSRSIDTH